jgi:hypothetical protein
MVRRRIELDFYKACISINKTPLHTPKTAKLRGLRKIARSRSAELDKELALLLDESPTLYGMLSPSTCTPL